jgi:hypothetical protein
MILVLHKKVPADGRASAPAAESSAGSGYLAPSGDLGIPFIKVALAGIEPPLMPESLLPCCIKVLTNGVNENAISVAFGIERNS